MANDPKYVRLANRLSQGMVADVHGSGWSIAGLDVRAFPEDRVAARFVRSLLRDGTVEPASKAEWEDVHDDPAEAEQLRQRPDHETESGFQEAHLQRAAQAGNLKLREAREEDDDEEALAAVEEDRNERLAQAEDDETDDPEEQISRSNPTRTTKSTKAKAKKKKAKTADE